MSKLLHKTRRALAGLFIGALGLAVAGCATTPEAAVPAAERAVTIATADGSADALLFTPAGSGPHPAVIVWSDLGGLRPVFGDIGRRLSASGYVVLVPNSFYRSARLDGGTAPGTLSREEMGERFGAWRGALDAEAIGRDTGAYLDFLAGLPQVDGSARAGMLGYQAGAEHAFRGAIANPGRIGAVAGLYPLGVATTRDNSPHLQVGQTSADYLVVLSANDDAREPEDKDLMREEFARAGLAGEVVVSSADNGFAVVDNPAYDEAESEKAWARMLALFGGAL